jgi:uncharacterized protein HemX
MSAAISNQLPPAAPSFAQRALQKLIESLPAILLAIVAGYGAVRFTEGQTQQRLTTVEARSKENQDAIEKRDDRYVIREEYKQFIDATREDLREIKQDVRAIRSDLRGSK